MKIIREKDFIKVIEYELSFVEKEVQRATIATKAAMRRLDQAEKNFNTLVETLRLGLTGKEWGDSSTEVIITTNGVNFKPTEEIT